MLIDNLQKIKFTRKLVYRLGRDKLIEYFRRIKPYLKPTDKILDIGAGTCNLEEILIDNGFNVTPIDIKNLSFVDGINPLIYDGVRIPFKDNSFDTSLLLTVLHHTPNPEMVIREAMRVSKKIIIIEDIYKSLLQKQLTFVMDNISNLEFSGNPHNNKDDEGWKGLFKKLSLKLVGSGYEPFWCFFQSVTYCLEKQEKK